MANLRTNNLSGEGGTNAYRGSVFFDGEDKTYLSLASGALISGTGFGTGDFTVEFWINQGINTSNYTNLISLYASTNTDRFQIAIHSSTIQVYTATGSWADTGYAPTAGVYEHIAFQRDYSGNTLKMYANGVEKWSVSNNHDYNEVFETYIGDYTSAAYNTFQGYLSNIRICMGHLVYSSNYFTPPTSELEVHYISENDKTILLCCQDSDDPTQEATGKTITAYGGVDFSHNPDNLIKNGNFDVSATENWTLTGGTAALGTGQSGTFNDGNHLVLTATSSYAYLTQAFTTKIGRRYRVNAQSNGADNSFISTTTSESDAVITDIRSTTQTTDGRVAEKNFVATQTTYYMILRGGTGGGNFDTASAYEEKTPTPPKVIPPVGVDAGSTFDGAITMNSSSWMYFPTGRTEERGRGRALFAGGYAVPQASAIKEIYYSQIQSTGTVIDFGDLTTDRWIPSSGASSTRGLFMGGGSPSRVDVLDFVTIATTSNATDFGDLITQRTYHAGFSNSTRAITGGGNDGSSTLDSIEFVTIATAGDGTDFGDFTTATTEIVGDCSPTRGLFMGGNTPTRVNTVEQVTIATTGNATDFGDLTAASSGGSALSSNTRALYGGGAAPTYTNTIVFFTIATTGDATNFGDLTVARESVYGATSNNIRGVFVAGYKSPGTNINSIDHVTIASSGMDASDFGDLVYRTRGITATSDSHGGLS